MSDELTIPEKTSRWSDAEREGGGKNIDGVSAMETRVPPGQSEQPPLPAWLSSFHPGSTFLHEGWRCAVRHVGFEGGVWMMLVEPLAQEAPRVMSRSEYKRLVHQVGKKATREILKERKSQVAGGEPEVEGADDDRA